MNKISKVLIVSIVCILLSNLVSAFGYFRETDLYDFIGMSGFGMLVGLGLSVILIGALLFVFWLWMLVDCLKRDFKKDYEKVVWVLVMIFLHVLGALIYYFVVKISDKKIQVKKK